MIWADGIMVESDGAIVWGTLSGPGYRDGVEVSLDAIEYPQDWAALEGAEDREAWEIALDALEATDPHTWRHRQLCSEDNPDVHQRDAHRRHVTYLARGVYPPAKDDVATPDDLALRAYFDKPRRCCGGAVI